MPRRTALELPLESFGKSRHGAPLHWLPPRSDCDTLVLAGIHGEEPDTTVSLSRALRSIDPGAIRPDFGFILCANPDGVAEGTRGNARGVDLNRNFPTADWSAEPVTCRWHIEDDEELSILTGDSPGSEPETQAILELIRSHRPKQILSLHGPLSCIDDPYNTELGNFLAERTGLPLVGDVGYPTPGSLGTWGAENKIPVITWEFPPEGIEILSGTQVPTLVELIEEPG